MASYEIDYKLLAVWIVGIAAVIGSAYYVISGSAEETTQSLQVNIDVDEIEIGEQVTVTVTQEDEPVESAEIILEGQTATTDSNGQIQHEPEMLGEVTITAEYQGLTGTAVITVVPEETETEEDEEDETTEDEEDEDEDEAEETEDEEESQEDDGEGTEDESDEEEDESDEDVRTEPELQSPEDGARFRASDEASISFEFLNPVDEQYFFRIDGDRIDQGTAGSEEVELVHELEPGSYEWSVRSTYNQDIRESDTRDITVLEPAEVSILHDLSGNDLNELTVTFEVEQAPEYRVNVDGDAQEEAEATNRDTYAHTFDEEGTHTVEIQAIENGEVLESESSDFTVEGPGQASANWVSDTEINSYQPEVEIEVISDVDYNYYFEVVAENGEEFYTDEFEIEEADEIHQIGLEPLPEGTHSYEINITNSRSRQIEQTEGTFETTEQRPVADLQQFEYEFIDEEHTSQISFEAFEDLEYSLELEGDVMIDDEEFTGHTLQLSEDLGDLQEGEQYEMEVSFSSLETDKTLEETETFTAE